MSINKTTYLHTFAAVTVLLALVRCAYHSNFFDKQHSHSQGPVACADTSQCQELINTQPTQSQTQQSDLSQTKKLEPQVAEPKYHRILSVPSYKTAFPDSNNVQMLSAQRYGVSPVANRVDAERRKAELVYVAANPFFHVDPLRESIPYLVPRASVLLQDIGRAFYDSLYVKGVPLHQVIVTSVLRTEEDVVRLRRHNSNASENSCHRYGTTFDVCYNRYVTVQTQSQPRRQVRNDTLKWVLSEVLRDMRQAGRCHVKYEVKQGCFHITVR